MTGHRFDVLVVGDLNPDLVMWADDPTPRFGQVERLVDGHVLTVGGSAAITACGLARLGLSVGLVAAVGDDWLGEEMVARVRARGVDVEGVKVTAVSTGISVILSAPDDRAILTSTGSLRSLQGDDIDAIDAKSARHLHLASPFLLGQDARSRLPDLAKRMRAVGATVSLDTNWDPSEGWEVSDLLAHVDILLPNAREAIAITGSADPNEAINMLLTSVPTVVIKDGVRGGLLRTETAEYRAEAREPGLVVDTVGAGDAFDAGFIAARMISKSPQVALEWAVAAGTLSTCARGGVDGQATVDEIEAWLRG